MTYYIMGIVIFILLQLVAISIFEIRKLNRQNDLLRIAIKERRKRDAILSIRGEL